MNWVMKCSCWRSKILNPKRWTIDSILLLICKNSSIIIFFQYKECTLVLFLKIHNLSCVEGEWLHGGVWAKIDLCYCILCNRWVMVRISHWRLLCLHHKELFSCVFQMRLIPHTLLLKDNGNLFCRSMKWS